MKASPDQNDAMWQQSGVFLRGLVKRKRRDEATGTDQACFSDPAALRPESTLNWTTVAAVNRPSAVCRAIGNEALPFLIGKCRQNLDCTFIQRKATPAVEQNIRTQGIQTL